MVRSYNALTGVELLTALAKSVTQLAMTIPGLNSRLVTFPKVEVEVTIRLRAYDRSEVTVESMDTFIDRLVAEGIDQVSDDPARDEIYSVKIDETSTSADAIRRGAGIAVTRPVPLTDGRIVEVADETANPLPAGENLDNIVQFGAPGAPVPGTDTPGSGRGRVIDLQNTGNINVPSEVIRPKLKGDSQASHFRIRQPS